MKRFQFDLWIVFLVVTWIASSFGCLRGVAEFEFYPERSPPAHLFIAPMIVAVLLTYTLLRRGSRLWAICLAFLTSNFCMLGLGAMSWEEVRPTGGLMAPVYGVVASALLVTSVLVFVVVIPTWFVVRISLLPTTMDEIYTRYGDEQDSAG